MSIPSLRDAQRRLSAALAAVDNWHAEALRALPDDHTWRDVDLLDIERRKRAIAAHDAYAADRLAFEAYAAEHPDE